MEEESMLPHYYLSISEWDAKGETGTFIFFAEPADAIILKKELHTLYEIKITKMGMYGWDYREVSITKE